MKKLAIFLVAASMIVALFACNPKESAPETYNKYDIELTIADDLKSVSLSETVTLNNSYGSEISGAVFYLYPNAYRKDALTKAYFNNLSVYGGIDVTSVTSGEAALSTELSDNLTALRVSFGAPLKPGEAKDITICANLTVPSVNLRFGLQDGILNLGNFYPILSVFENGAWREDAYSKIGDPFYFEAADYKVTVNCSAGTIVAASGDTREEAVTADRQRIVTSAEKIRDFALVVSKNFKVLEGISGDTAIKYYYTGSNTPEARLDTAIKAFSAFEGAIGDYPYKTYSIVETPFYYGGMEYSNLVFINKNASDKESTIIHETAHQWFGCMVGSDSVNKGWLDEALATYLTDYYYILSGDNERYASLTKDSKNAYNAFITIKLTDDPAYSPRIEQPIYDFATNYEYSMVVYVKGGLMFESIYNVSGRQKFEKSLREYFENNKFGVASPDDLYAAFKANRKDIKPIAEAWLNDKVIIATFN